MTIIIQWQSCCRRDPYYGDVIFRKKLKKYVFFFIIGQSIDYNIKFWQQEHGTWLKVEPSNNLNVNIIIDSIYVIKIKFQA